MNIINNVDGDVAVTVSNTNSNGPSASSSIKIITSADEGTILTQNAATKTFTVQNKDGGVRIISKGAFGINIAADTGDLISDSKLTISSTVDATSVDNGGALTVRGGAAIKKKLLVGGDLYVSGSTTTEGNVTQPVLVTPSGDMINVTTLTVRKTKMIKMNDERLLFATLEVSPTVAGDNVQYTVRLPEKVSTLVNRLDLNSATASGFADDTNVYVLQNILCTGVTGSRNVLVKFQAIDTSIHYIQIFVSYTVD